MQPKHAYMQGRHAFADGQQLDANPYQTGSADAYQWQTGMLDAYQEWTVTQMELRQVDQPLPDSRTEYYVVCIANLKKQQQSRGSQTGFCIHHPPHPTIQ